MLYHNRRANKEQKFRSSADYGQTVMNPTDRGMLVTVTSSFSLGYVAEINQSFLQIGTSCSEGRASPRQSKQASK